MLRRLRARPGAFGLVTANGNYVTKHAFGVYSTTAPAGPWRREAPSLLQAQLDAMPKAPFTETPQGEATVETYTVMHGRAGPEFAVVFGRLDATGQRFIANLPDDPAGLWALQNRDSLGRPGRVQRAADGRNLFLPDCRTGDNTMYPGKYATQHPDRPAFIMANTGEAVSYRDFEARSNRLAHLLRAQGLKRLDHYAIFMENNNRFLEACSAGYRAGLYFTCINSFLTAEELAYIVNNSESQLLITSRAKLAVAREALKSCPQVKLCLVVDGGAELQPPFQDYAAATAAYPATPIADEQLGTAMLYSSGTTGRPKGIVRPLPRDAAVGAAAAVPLPAQAVALPRGHGLPVAGADVPLGAECGGEPDAGRGRHRDHHGALRPRAVPEPDPEVQGHAQPAGADDVQPPAQAAATRSATCTTARRWRSPSMPPHPARCR